jgi:hypothetical protein
MNCIKIEKTLREQTMNLFSNDWYKDTALKIAKDLKVKSPEYGQVILNFSIKEFQTLHKFFETLEINRVYSNKEFLPMVQNVVVGITPKRVKLELKKFARSNKLYIKINNMQPIGRTFVLLKDL